jgi:rod shape determining protein RodA
MALIVAAPFLLILVEPSLGTSLTLVPPACAMVCVAIVPPRWVIAGSLSLFLAASLGLCLLLAPNVLGLDEDAWRGMLSRTGVREYQLKRIESFVEGTGWNEKQSRVCVSTGGLWGKGYLRGTQKQLGYLPRTVAPSDFIFAVLAEEFGFAGSLAILALYAVIVHVGLAFAAAAGNGFARYLATGVVVLLATHACINIAMTIGLLPVTGLPLPLLSRGGSFLLSTMLGLGIVRGAGLAHLRSTAKAPQPTSSEDPCHVQPPPRRLYQMEFEF